MIYSKYKYIAAVAELRSISKAAQKLYISQPALTRIVMNIEEELGTPLFNRAALPIQLTYAGERYLEEARRVLAIDSSLRRELQEISEMKRGLLKIGTNYAASNLWLPHILPVFRREYPGITISLIQQNSLLFEGDLLRENIDLAFTTSSASSTNLTYEYLSSARILLFIPADHPILWGRDLSGNSIDNILTLPPEVLNDQDFVLLHPTDGFGFTVAGLMKASGIHPATVLYAPSIVACYRMAASGMGITFATPYATRYTLPGLVPVIAELSMQAAYEHNAIAYSRKKKLSAIEQRFIAIAKDKVCNAPLLQPLCSAQWLKLKTPPYDSSDFRDFA